MCTSHSVMEGQRHNNPLNPLFLNTDFDGNAWLGDTKGAWLVKTLNPQFPKVLWKTVVIPARPGAIYRKICLLNKTNIGAILRIGPRTTELTNRAKNTVTFSNNGSSMYLFVYKASCEGAPCKWPLTFKVVSESRVTSATSDPILVFLGLSVLDLGPMYSTHRRQTRIIA